MVKILFFLVITIFILLLLAGLLRTWKTQTSPNQKLFLNSHLPNPLPGGLYKGSVNFQTNWQGKKFDLANSSGINIINGKEAYPFKTYTGKGLADKNLEVLRIDYNLPSNPLWLRFILDEMVQTQPQKYLGKVHINFIPGIHFTLGFFKLEK